MESNYTIEKTKQLHLAIKPDYSCELKDIDDNLQGFLPYDIYNINCFFDPKSPTEFLSVLFSHVSQNFLNITFTNGNIYSGRNIIAKYITSKRHIILESDNTYDVLDMTYGNKINTFNVLKYLLNCMSIENQLNKIRNYKCEAFTVISIINNTRNYNKGFGCIHMPSDNYTVTILDEHHRIEFIALFNIKDKTLTFISYLHHEGETYYHGDEELTLSDIDVKIQYYSKLKFEIQTIETYLNFIQKTL